MPRPLARHRIIPRPLQNLQETLGPPGGREIQAPGKPLVIAPAIGRDPDLDTLCDPHSGHVFNAVNCKHESDQCQYIGSVIIPGYVKSDLDTCKDAIQCRPWATPPYRILLANRFQIYLPFWTNEFMWIAAFFYFEN